MWRQVVTSGTWKTRRLLVRAWRALLALDVKEAERLVRELDHSEGGTIAQSAIRDCSTVVLRAALLAVQDDSTGAMDLVRQAHEADLTCRSLAATICRWAHCQAGEVTEFHGVGRGHWRLTSHRRQAIAAIFDLDLEAAVEFGRLRLAVSGRLAAEALELSRSRTCSESAAGLLAAALVAQVAYEQGQLNEAEAVIRYRMRAIRNSATIECVTRAYVILARLAVHRQQSDSALTLLQDAQNLAEKRSWPRLAAAALAERIRILLDDGETTAALSSLRVLEALVGSQPATGGTVRADIELHCQLAHLRFMQRRAVAADTATAVESLRQSAIARSDLRLALEMHLISVSAYAQCGERFEAQERLIDALDIGAANGLCMTFVDAGPVVRKLLSELCQDPSISDERVLELRPYIHTLLARSSGPQLPASAARRQPEAVRQPLTRRESNVLRLIANGLSNKRIAQRLDITPETVKSHAKSIFVKLAAQTRAQAVARAEALGLI